MMFIFLMFLIITFFLMLLGLMFWGAGYFIIWVFDINYIWTYWHGLSCLLFYMVMVGIFKK